VEDECLQLKVAELVEVELGVDWKLELVSQVASQVDQCPLVEVEVQVLVEVELVEVSWELVDWLELSLK